MTPGESWRRDFPTDQGSDEDVTRREFTKFLVLSSGAAAAGSGWYALQAVQHGAERFHRQEVAAVTGVQPGEARLFHYPDADEPAILIRLRNGEFVAFKQRCTHLTCPVYYSPDRDRLDCPCHNGAFDAATGAVLFGPPPRPLPRIVLEIDGGTVYATGVLGT